MRSKDKRPRSRAPGAPREDDPAYVSGYEPTRSVRAADGPGLAHEATEAVHLSGLEATEAVHLDQMGGLEPVDTEPSPHHPPDDAPPGDSVSFAVPLSVDHAAFGAAEPTSRPSARDASRSGSRSQSAQGSVRSASAQRTSHLGPHGGRTGPQRPKARTRKRSGKERHDPNIGRELGSYRLISLLGSGGMGQVYKAEHVMLGRMVALKLLRPEYAAKRDAVHRFFQEARAVNAIGHQNIVDVTDYVELESGETFFIMELLEGQDLGDLLRNSEDPIPLHHAMQISLAVCDALHAAHETEIIHRDLKPDNIFIVNDGRRKNFVKLLDFGVAKLQGEASAQASYQTAAGSVIGTPAYMSPEQASGIPVDRRTDIYSLGAILYEMFTGRPVFDAKSFGEFVVKHMNDQPIPPRDLKGVPKIPMALEQVILRCLEKDPADRYHSVEGLREDLARATATVETPLRRSEAPRRRRRRPWMAIPVGLALLALAGVAFWIAAGLGVEDFKASDPPSTASSALPSPGGSAVDTSLETTRPKKVRVSLRSTPAGAEVFRKGESRALGKTPLNLPLGQLGEAGKPLTLVFELAGYHPLEQTVELSAKAEVLPVSVALKAMPVANVSPLKKEKRRAKRRTKRRTSKKRPPPTKTASPPPTKKPKKVGKTDQVDPFAP